MEKNTDQPVRVSVASRVLPDGRLVELVLPRSGKKTLLAVSSGAQVDLVDELHVDGELFVPVSAANSLIKNDAILLPEGPEAYGDVAALVADIETYFDRYVTLSDWFRQLAAYYVLFSWVYDAFEELPYLRVQAEHGSGKTRALIVIGSLCYRAFLASGAATVSPIFHTLDTFRGTLVLDETDFRFSDATNELVKVFNNGNVRGFPVFRTAITLKREFDPRAFHVYGPKLVAMRRSFDDEALESRFITERLDGRRMHPGIPINLPAAQRVEARTLRNKLLQYRFDHRLKLKADDTLVDPLLSPRANQILVPLLSVIPDERARAEIRMAVGEHERERVASRATSTIAELIEVLAELSSEKSGAPVSIADLTARFTARYGAEYERPITARYVGSLLRTRLGITTYKSQGAYHIAVNAERLSELARRYGLARGENQAS